MTEERLLQALGTVADAVDKACRENEPYAVYIDRFGKVGYVRKDSVREADVGEILFFVHPNKKRTVLVHWWRHQGRDGVLKHLRDPHSYHHKLLRRKLR